MILNCSSLMVSDIEHIFMYLMAVCMYSSEKCLLMPSAHFVIMFLGVALKFFFIYILYSILYQILFANIFFLVCCLFILLMVSLTSQKPYNFM